jgi:hypothetical protein
LTATVAGAPPDWRVAAAQRWAELCGRVGREWTLRSLLEHLTGEDVLEGVRTVLQRHLAAHLDLGVGAWHNPQRGQGFYAAWRASAREDLVWELDDLSSVRDELAWLPDDPVDALAETLPELVADADLWPGYLERLALELPGWSGMFLWRDRNPAGGDGTPVAMADYLAVRALLERLLCQDLLRRLTGAPLALDDLRAHYAARPAEFLVRDAWRSGALAEELQHRAARLCRLPASGNDADWEALAMALATAGSGDLAEARAVRLCALAGRLDLAAGDLAAMNADEAAALLACAASLGPCERGHVWLLAYERHYREELFAALVANRSRRRTAGAASAQARAVTSRKWRQPSRPTALPASSVSRCIGKASTTTRGRRSARLSCDRCTRYARTPRPARRQRSAATGSAAASALPGASACSRRPAASRWPGRCWRRWAGCRRWRHWSPAPWRRAGSARRSGAGANSSTAPPPAACC